MKGSFIKSFIIFLAIAPAVSCTVKSTSEIVTDSTQLATDTLAIETEEQEEIIQIPETEDPNIGENFDDEPTEPYGDPQSIQCTFLGYDEGDCRHLNFSCGDFGVAETSYLDEEDRALWHKLTMDDGQEGTIANPELINQKFTIVFNHIEGWPCQGGYPDTELMQKGEIQNIIKFDLN